MIRTSCSWGDMQNDRSDEELESDRFLEKAENEWEYSVDDSLTPVGVTICITAQRGCRNYRLQSFRVSGF